MEPLIARRDLTRAGGREAPSVDYVAYVANERDLNFDFFDSFLNTIFLDIVQMDGATLISEIGAVERYSAERSRGKSVAEAEFWANLLVLSDVVRAQARDGALKVSRLVAMGCSTALKESRIVNPPPVRILENAHEGEVYIVCARWTGPFKEVF